MNRRCHTSPVFYCFGLIARRPYTEQLLEISKKAKVIIRTGSFDPWGNVVLVSGINAPVWFSKPGIVTPEFYTNRVGFEDKDYPFPV